MKICKLHKAYPVTIYNDCIGCEIYDYQEQIELLKNKVNELKLQIEQLEKDEKDGEK